MRWGGGPNLPARLALLPWALYHVTHLTQSPAFLPGVLTVVWGSGWMFSRQSSRR